MGRDTPPILEPTKHHFNPVAPFVVFHRFRSLFPARDAGAYPSVFQCLSEPVGAVSSVPEQSIDIRQAAQQRPCSHVIADLCGSDEQLEQAALAVADGVQLGVHSEFGSANQTTTHPFFTPMLVAVLWVFR